MDSNIDIRFDRSGLKKGRGELTTFTRSIIDHTLRELGWTGAGISILFCSDKEIQRLNREFRDLDEPTDILSFPAADDPESLRGDGDVYLGDLAISLTYTARHAHETKRKVEDEIALLLVHGMLHLLGWDHDTKAKEKRMWKEQERLLTLALRHVNKPVVNIL